MCKTITVYGERKGGKCGKPTSNSLSFPIIKSVATKHPGGRYVPTHCPRLPANVTATLSPPIGQMDSLRYVTSAVGVCGRWREGQTRVWARLPPVPARLSATTPPPPHGSDSRGPVRSQNTDGQTGGRPSMWRHSRIAGVRLDCTRRQRCGSTTNSSAL